LSIADEALGQPRQPVPLRLACLVAGLTCADFRYLLAEIQAGGQQYLIAYEYRPGDAPRLVPADHYRSSLPAPPRELPTAAFLEALPRDHFVWSDDLAAAFRQFIFDCPGPEQATADGWGLNWHPALLGMDGLIEECADLSTLAIDARATDASHNLTPRELGKQQTAARYKRLQEAGAPQPGPGRGYRAQVRSAASST
jgi:hypothetical protein